jgi:hypothetical protein
MVGKPRTSIRPFRPQDVTHRLTLGISDVRERATVLGNAVKLFVKSGDFTNYLPPKLGAVGGKTPRPRWVRSGH